MIKRERAITFSQAVWMIQLELPIQ